MNSSCIVRLDKHFVPIKALRGEKSLAVAGLLRNNNLGADYGMFQILCLQRLETLPPRRSKPKVWMVTKVQVLLEDTNRMLGIFR